MRQSLKYWFINDEICLESSIVLHSVLRMLAKQHQCIILFFFLWFDELKYVCYYFYSRAPDYRKGISAAQSILKLLNRKPSIDNCSSEGQTIVNWNIPDEKLFLISSHLSLNLRDHWNLTTLHFVIRIDPNLKFSKTFSWTSNQVRYSVLE